MRQTNKITRKMTAEQEAFYAGFDKQSLKFDPIEARPSNQAVVYRLYTEDLGNLTELTSRYFSGFTLLFGNGVYQGVAESGVVIEVIGSTSDLQSVVHLAGDIRQVNNQSSVLVTWNNVSLLNVTA